MRTSSIFTPANPALVTEFLNANLLAQVVSWNGLDAEATPLPLITETNEDGAVVALIGHFSRTNPQLEMIRKNSRAICIFFGAHGYVSPSWMADRSQAPTWNFETIHFIVNVELYEQEEATAQAIEALLNATEKTEKRRWHSRELGERYPKLLRHVIGFRAHVLETRVKFKLGQNERDDVYQNIIDGLHSHDNSLLAKAMERANQRCPHIRTEQHESKD